jgi:serine protease Do
MHFSIAAKGRQSCPPSFKSVAIRNTTSQLKGSTMKRLFTKSHGLIGLSVLSLSMLGLLAAKHSEGWTDDHRNTPVVYQETLPPSVSDEQAERALSSAKDLSIAFRVASERVLPSVVAIETRPNPVSMKSGSRHFGQIPEPGNPFAGTPFEDFFKGLPRGDGFQFQIPTPDMIPQQGLGSGVVIDSSGLVMTNHHVVRGTEPSRITVRLQDGREFTATDVWSDPKTDIAIVKIEAASDLIAARLGDSDQITVGDWVLALGQPFGLESTVTAGIISATHRGVAINARENFLQTDAAINPGNSGGPLVNLDGEVVGINTAISSHNGSNSGVGFAVPINIAKWVGEQLAENGKVRRAYLGIGIQQIDASLAEQLGTKPREGVIVTQVHPGTPAEQAGLKTGDVILDFAGLKIRSPRDLQFAAERAATGKTHELNIIRDGQAMTKRLVPEELPTEVSTGMDGHEQGLAPRLENVAGFGLEIGDLTPEIARQLGEPDSQGVVITQVDRGSAADQAGLRPGMIITQVNREGVQSVDECRSALQQSGNRALLLVRFNGASRFVILQVGAKG